MKNQNKDQPMQLLWQFMWEKRWNYTLSVIAIILSEIVYVQFPNLLGEFTNTLQAGRLTSGKLAYYAIALMTVGVLQVALYGFGQYRNGETGRLFEYQLRKRLFGKWETLTTAYFRKKSVGDLLNHAMTDVQAVREALSGGMNIFTNAIFLLLTTLYMTFTTISISLTLLSIIPILFIPFFVVWFGPRIRQASKQVQEALSDMAEFTEESLTAIRLIKATANETIDTNRFSRRVDTIVHRQLSMISRSALFQSFIPLMGSLSFAIALSYGGYLTIHGNIKLGSFVAFTLYLAMIITPLQQIGFVIINFQRASASLQRLQTLLTVVPEIDDPIDPIPTQTIHGEIVVALDEYRYPDAAKTTLHDIHFTLSVGKTLGIVGRTGSGKTTLVNLLPRIFDAKAGSVMIDGHPIHQYRLQDLREAIAYVPQDGFLFSTTIKENIEFGRDHATEEEIVQAAQDAAMYDDIMAFQEGFATQIGERGVSLSGGQKQRTAIARALLKEAPILIMDDSLSAVDMNTEKKILAALTRLRKNRTTMIVAHRLSAVRDADWILVLENGTILEQGTHEQLLALNKEYKKIYDLQEAGSDLA